MKFRRPRNRRSSSNVNLRNQTFDSSGPTGKVRGTAQQVYEKYIALARDVGNGLNSDRILAEKYYQFADHYYRLLLEAREQEERHQLKGQEKASQNMNSEVQPEYQLPDDGQKAKSDELKKVETSTPHNRRPRRNKLEDEKEGVSIADVDFLSSGLKSESKTQESEESLVPKKRGRRTKKTSDQEKDVFKVIKQEDPSNIKVLSADQ